MDVPTVPIPVETVRECDWVALLVRLSNGKTTLFWGEVYEKRSVDDHTEFRLNMLPYDGRELVFQTTEGDDPELVPLPYYSDQKTPVNLEIGPDGARSGIMVEEVLGFERIPADTMPPIEDREYKTTPSATVC